MTITESPENASPPAENPDLMRNAVRRQFEADFVRPPEEFFEAGTEDFGEDPLPKDQFLTAGYHQREARHLWRKIWQMACRERAVANPGDYVTYEIVDQSVLIVRDKKGELKAYHNVCLHRGTRLAEGAGQLGAEGAFSCSFHGWTWNLDGSLKRVPCAWDFPKVEPSAYGLREVRVGTWDGWVFVNLDPQAPPLADYLGEVLPRHFSLWPMKNRRIVAYGAKVLPCNWKVAIEAFMETYHVLRTHPESIPYAYDAGAQYDQWGLHARMIQLVGKASPHLLPGTYDEQEVVDAVLGGQTTQVGEEPQTPRVPEGSTARKVLADGARAGLTQVYGIDLSAASDSEVLDAVEYYIFPNFIVWGGYSFPIVYRSRPNGNDHESCFFEAMLVAPDGEDPGPDAEMQILPTETSWAEAPGMGGIGYVLDQDDRNIRKIQLGLHSDGLTDVSFSQYQEGNIRALHHGVKQYLEAAAE